MPPRSSVAVVTPRAWKTRLIVGILIRCTRLDDVVHERTMEGLNAARKRGRLGGRPKIPKADVEAAFKMYDSKSFTLNTTVTPKKSGLPK